MSGEKPGLYAKLLGVLSAIDHVEKNGRNDFHRYDYAREADVAAVVRRAMVEHRILCMPTVTSYEVDPVTTKKGDVERIFRVVVEYRFIDADTGDSISSQFVSEGQDPGDKGVYKAYSGGLKYALLKTFQIPTGDDPENDGQQSDPRAEVAEQRKRHKISDADWPVMLLDKWQIEHERDMTNTQAATIAATLKRTPTEAITRYLERMKGGKAS